MNSKKILNMDANKLNSAKTLVSDINNKTKTTIKIVKKDKGLLERTESEKVILTEDNRQIILG